MDSLTSTQIRNALYSSSAFQVDGERYTIGKCLGRGTFGAVFKLKKRTTFMGNTIKSSTSKVVKISLRPLCHDIVFDEDPDTLFCDVDAIHSSSNPWPRMGMEQIKRLMQHHGVAESEEMVWFERELNNLNQCFPLAPHFNQDEGEEEMASKPCAHGRIVWINAAPHSAILMGKCAKIKVTPEIASKILNLVLELGREKRTIYVDANIDNFMQCKRTASIKCVDFSGQWVVPIQGELAVDYGVVNAAFLAISCSDSVVLDAAARFLRDKLSSPIALVPNDFEMCESMGPRDWKEVIMTAIPFYLKRRLGDRVGDELANTMMTNAAREVRQKEHIYSTLLYVLLNIMPAS